VFRGAALALTFVLCASALADPTGKNVVIPKRQQHQTVSPRKVIYYVHSSASAIPIPITRLQGFTTTIHPMQIIGRRPKLPVD
jgi:hypothetical protein